MEESIMSINGRIRRTTFWTRWLIVFFINIFLTMLRVSTRDQGIVIIILLGSLALAIFMLIQSVKRMHDVNKSGWYSLIPLYNLILAVTDGTSGFNQYGKDPKSRRTVCPSCQTLNDPENAVCQNCSMNFYRITQEETKSSNSDTLILFFLIYGAASAFIHLGIEKLVDQWYTSPVKYVVLFLNLVWGASLILLALAVKNETNKMIGLIVAIIWMLYVTVSNISWVFNLELLR